MAFLLLVLRSHRCWKPARPVNGLATASRPSTIFSGNAGRGRGDGTTNHLRSCLRVIKRVVARAFEQLPVGVPIGHVAAGVQANCRIGDHAVGGAFLGLGVEPVGVEAQQQHLVEPRAVTQVFVSGSIGQAKVCLPSRGSSSGFNGSGLAVAVTLTNRSPSFGRSRAASVCAEQGAEPEQSTGPARSPPASQCTGTRDPPGFSKRARAGRQQRYTATEGLRPLRP